MTTLPAMRLPGPLTLSNWIGFRPAELIRLCRTWTLRLERAYTPPEVSTISVFSRITPVELRIRTPNPPHGPIRESRMTMSVDLLMTMQSPSGLVTCTPSMTTFRFRDTVIGPWWASSSRGPDGVGVPVVEGAVPSGPGGADVTVELGASVVATPPPSVVSELAQAETNNDNDKPNAIHPALTTGRIPGT